MKVWDPAPAAPSVAEEELCGGLFERRGELMECACVCVWARDPWVGGGARCVGERERRVVRNSTVLRRATASEHHAERACARQAAALCEHMMGVGVCLMHCDFKHDGSW